MCIRDRSGPRLYRKAVLPGTLWVAQLGMRACPSWRTYTGESAFSWSRGPIFFWQHHGPANPLSCLSSRIFCGQHVCWYGLYRCPSWQGTHSLAPHIHKHTHSNATHAVVTPLPLSFLARCEGVVQASVRMFHLVPLLSRVRSSGIYSITFGGGSSCYTTNCKAV